MRLMYATGRITGSFPKPKATKKQPEWHEQLVFCKYLHLKYPDVEFFSDLSSAGSQTKYMQGIVKILKSNSGWPDTKIYEPIGKYVGCAIEVKKIPKTQGESIWKLDGTLKADEHVENQDLMHKKLRKRGWAVYFAEGADQAIDIWEHYAKGEALEQNMYRKVLPF